MAKKKITRKQLLKEPDEFITITGKIIRTARAYSNQILYGAGALVLILAVASGIRYYNGVKENRAFSMYETAMARYTAQNKADGPVKAYQEVRQEFDQILKKYSGNSGGKLARFAYADICYRAGEFDRAVELLTRSLRDFEGDAFYSTLVVNSIGHSHEGKKDFEAAAASFEKLAAAPESHLKDEALFHLGRIYQTMGNSEKSRTAFRKIISDHPSSFYMNLVKEKLPAMPKRNG